MAIKLGYYPGCALHGSESNYGKSVEAVFAELGVDLREIKNWNCCGASSGHMISSKLSPALNARNLALAAEQGHMEVVTPCPLCSEGMLSVLKKSVEKEGMKEQLEKIIERKLNTNVKVLNIVESIERTREIWEPRVKNHKSDLKMAAYYGCLLVRPPDIVKFDNPENPQSIEKLIKDFGYQPVQWEFRTECCGGGFTVSNAGDVATLVGRIYDDALFHEADAIVCVCPMCLANLEMRTGEASAKFKREFKMPVVYLTDLLGLAIGMKPASFGFDKHLSDISKVAQVSV